MGISEADSLAKAAGSLAWTEGLTTAVAAFDDDHRRLIVLYNEFEIAVLADQPVAVVVAALDRLIEFTSRHFRDEEEAMHRTRFPGAVAHAAEHDRLITEIADLRHDLLRRRLAWVDAATLAHVRDWLLTHTAGLDREYGPHLNAHGIR